MALLESIQQALRNGTYRVTNHGAEEMLADEITEAEVLMATFSGGIIEDYPNAFPYPACLVLGRLPGGAFHAVWGYDAATCYAFLITVYRPDPARWTPDFRKRVKK